MWMSLGLSVTLLINLPFFGKVDVRRMLHSRRQATAADSLPTPWRNPSRLALENEFVTGELPTLGAPRSAIRFTNDPRELHVAVDADSGTLVVSPELGDVRVGPAGEQEFSQYGRRMTERSFYSQWNRAAVDHINDLNTANTLPSSASGAGFSFRLPSPLPRRMQGLLGPGGPALNVRGSENIRISGTSNWTNQQVGPLGQKKSLFPSLDMQQDLDIQLEGQLSDRIRVNLLQNSANQIPLSNRIAINYRGDEDALFQQIDLGNTNLSLPGTQYVSYSGKNEGLFGMKATSRFGPLDLTLLASKQEGRSERAAYAGGASKQVQTLRDLEYVRGVYFLIGDPNEGPFEIPDASIRVYRDDNISSNDVNVVRGMALPDPGAVNVALNSPPGSPGNNPSISDSTSLGTGPVAIRGQFDQLNRGADRDYEILSDVYGTGFKVLRVTQPLLSSQRLAVTYQRRPQDATADRFEDFGGFKVLDRDADSSLVMKLIRVPLDLIGRTGAGLDAVFDPGAALYPLRELELHNFYQLGGQRIDPATFRLSIQKGREATPKTTVQTDGGVVPFIEILGLDNFDESTGTPVRGHDNRVDGTLVSSTVRLFVDYENGTLFFLDPRPFAPRLGPSGKAFDNFIDGFLTRRLTLTGGPTSDTEPNPGIYDKYNIQPDTDARYYMDVEFNAARASGEISLGRGNLIEGSEVVTINGSTLSRGRDYDIDYDLGRMTLKRQLGPADQLNVDYSYAPLFQQAGRTLIGSAFTLQGRDRSLGGAFMYESRGAQDLRPRLGEEPARSVIGDLNSDWTFHPDWITRVVDLLPGVRTTSPSDFRVQAEVGASFPNPNTRNEVYIDDMEGVRDAVSLTLDPSRWRLSSVPSRADVITNGQAVIKSTMIELVDNGEHRKNAELHWYSPYAVVKERDLKPTLTDENGGQNNRQVLAFSVPRRPVTADSSPATLDSLWAGLTYPLDQNGLDLTKSQFIELWINDFNDQHNPGTVSPRVRGRHVKMHIDLGKVSEDQMRAPDERPDVVLNSEDHVPRDNSLDVTEGNNEDTGFDGRLTAGEAAAIVASTSPPSPLVLAEGRYRDLVTSSGNDPQGDDFKTPVNEDVSGAKAIDARPYLHINGTEDDKNVFPYPETEDMNLNGNLDREEAYFEYTIDLGDDASPYLVTDVQALKNAGDPGYASIGPDNGWRRYRISIDDSLRVQFGIPDLSIAQHVRVWLDGMTLPDLPADSTNVVGKSVERPLVLLGSLDIVGSRWRAADLDSVDVEQGATLTLNAVNSVDNADVYEAPFNPGQTRNGNQSLARREQSMALEFTHLSGGRSVEAFKTFSLDENYSRYGKLNWFVTGFDVLDSLDTITNDSLYYFVRFSSDELSRAYYEYRAPLPVSTVPRGKAWQEVRLDLEELSSIKLDPRFPLTRDTLFAQARTPGSADTLIVRGRPSFTRLRRVSFGIVNKRGTGHYKRGQLWFDELRAIDVAKDRGHAQRVQVNGRLSNLASYSLGWSGRDEDFLSVGEARGSGTSIDSYNFSGNIDLHRFFESTGIILPFGYGFAQNTAKPRFSAGDDVVRGGRDLERSESFGDSRSWNLAYSRTWSDRSNPVLRYTLGGVTANYSSANSHARNPAGGERTSTSSGGVSYNVALRQTLAVPVPIIKPSFYPLPERAYMNYRFDQRRTSTADRPVGTDDLIARSLVKGNSGTIQMGADSRPFDFLHHHIEALRNLNLPYRPLGKVNFGRVVNWNQTQDASYAARFVPFIRPQLNWSSSYSQSNGPELSSDLSVRAIQNGQQGGVRFEMPFASFGNKYPAPGDTTHRGPPLWRRTIGRLGSASGELSASRSSSYSRLVGMPDFFYLFGLTDNPHVDNPGDPSDTYRFKAVAGNQASKSFQWRATGRTTLDLFWKMTAQTSGEFVSQTSDANGAERGQEQLRLPDVTFEFGNMPALLKIDKVIRNPRLRSSVNRQVTTEFNNGRSEKSSVTKLIQFRPLLGLSGELPNGMRVEINTEHRHSDRELLQLGSSLQQDINTDADLSLTRTYSQGQKLSFLGKETTVRSSITIGLTGRYERQTGRIIQSGQERNPVNRDRMSLNANGSYGFSSTVSGNATFGYSQDKDKLRDIVHRSVRVEIAARFSL